ncbi:MAG: DEAD/DEAH box helicase [Candidatus Nanoarchaeia archaeon]
MKTFTNLGLDSDMLQAIDRMGYTQPTGIQEKAIPLILQGKDLLAGSATGSGKTFAFASGLIQKITSGKGVQILVLVPTRELAEQVKDAMNSFARFKKLTTAVIYGGVSFNPQFDALKKADIIVATPGRLLDHLQRGSARLDNVKHLVLDEADMMLDMGFIPDVTKIIKQCPLKGRQTLLFSATMPPEIRYLAKDFMKDPQKINHQTYVDPSKMNQSYYVVPNNLKLSLLVHLLKEDTSGLVMIFCNSRRITESVAKGLQKNGLDAQEIHGGLSQARRNAILKQFHKNKLLALVCTDVAARGLDIPDVTHIYNYDIPRDAKQYIHRAGRTARAGKDGSVVNILSDRDYDNFNKVLYENSDMDIVEKKRPFLERIELPSAGNRRSKNTQNRTGERTGFGRRGHFGSTNNQRTSGRGGNSRAGRNSSQGPRPTFGDDSSKDSNRNSQAGCKKYNRSQSHNRGSRGSSQRGGSSRARSSNFSQGRGRSRT